LNDHESRKTFRVVLLNQFIELTFLQSKSQDDRSLKVLSSVGLNHSLLVSTCSCHR